MEVVNIYIQIYSKLITSLEDQYTFQGKTTKFNLLYLLNPGGFLDTEKVVTLRQYPDDKGNLQDVKNLVGKDIVCHGEIGTKAGKFNIRITKVDIVNTGGK